MKKILVTGAGGFVAKDFFPDIDFDSVIRDKQKILSEVCRFGCKGARPV